MVEWLITFDYYPVRIYSNVFDKISEQIDTHQVFLHEKIVQKRCREMSITEVA
jgi:hypothetical protein